MSQPQLSQAVARVLQGGDRATLSHGRFKCWYLFHLSLQEFGRAGESVMHFWETAKQKRNGVTPHSIIAVNESNTKICSGTKTVTVNNRFFRAGNCFCQFAFNGIAFGTAH
eukprot:2341076-Amphidinium_carterae.1